MDKLAEGIRKIGTVIDRSYYLPFLRQINGNTYERQMCPYCDEEIELGYYKGFENAPYSVAPPHQCKSWVDEARHRNGYLTNYILPVEGFIFLKEPGGN